MTIIFKDTTPLTNQERLAIWIIKRGNTPLWFKVFKKPIPKAKLLVSQLKGLQGVKNGV